MTDIKSIWNELKEEDGVLLANTDSFFTSSIKKRSPSSTSAQRARQNFIDNIRCSKALDVDSLVIKETILTEQPVSPAEKCASESVDFILGEEFVDEGAHDGGLCIDAGDSDGDEEEHKPSAICDNQGDVRIARLVGHLKSDEISTRIVALTKLKQVISRLSLECPVAPTLDMPPPFDESKNVLERNLPLVSDLAKSMYNDERIKTELTLKSENLSDSDLSDSEQSLVAKKELQSIMDSCGKRLFQLMSDQSEKCRALSLECLQILFLSGVDLVKDIPYLIPTLIARYSRSAYDKELEVFVSDDSLHEFYKRGGAVNRQDRDGLLNQGSSLFQIIERDEELRLGLCQTLESLVRGLDSTRSLSLLDAYFTDIVLALHSSLRDPFPDVKIAACHLFVQLVRVPQWEAGAKHFATGLARAALPILRHRKTQVILAAMDLLEASIFVPNKAKLKGAGTGAISDLVGFQEENVLPIAAFYDPSCAVSVNTMAELASHKNHRVRARCCDMLSNFLVFLPDRHDHQTRLLPYILSFVNDTSPAVQNKALECIEKCGRQYEIEHPDDVIERLQLGVDGESSIDYDIGLPEPFTRRPSLGARLFVRSNTSRFYHAILSELSNWKGQTRKRSADLLRVVVVCCEEHLTKDFQHAINCIAKAIEVEKKGENESAHLNTLDTINQVVCLMSKYIDPAAYFPLLAPKIAGEGGCHSEQSRHSHLVILSSLIQGSPLHRLIPYWQKMADIVTSETCIGAFAGSKVCEASLHALFLLLDRANGDMISLVTYLRKTGTLSETVEVLKLCQCTLLQNGGVAAECSNKLSTLVSSMEQN